MQALRERNRPRDKPARLIKTMRAVMGRAINSPFPPQPNRIDKPNMPGETPSPRGGNRGERHTPLFPFQLNQYNRIWFPEKSVGPKRVFCGIGEISEILSRGVGEARKSRPRIDISPIPRSANPGGLRSRKNPPPFHRRKGTIFSGIKATNTETSEQFQRGQAQLPEMALYGSPPSV